MSSNIWINAIMLQLLKLIKKGEVMINCNISINIEAKTPDIFALVYRKKETICV